MKQLGNIYLSWREGLGKRRHIIGVLKQNSTKGVRFSYIKENIKNAIADGFTNYTEFPDLDKEYTENVLDIFGQRIMKSERTDIADFYKFWEIEEDKKLDKFYLLALTQGLNPADNFEFLADYNPQIGFKFLTDIANLSNLHLPANTVKKGDVLTYKCESDNVFDNKAVKVFLNDKEIGYIKKIHSTVFYKTKTHKPSLVVKAVDQNTEINRIFVMVSF